MPTFPENQFQSHGLIRSESEWNAGIDPAFRRTLFQLRFRENCPLNLYTPSSLPSIPISNPDSGWMPNPTIRLFLNTVSILLPGESGEGENLRSRTDQSESYPQGENPLGKKKRRLRTQEISRVRLKRQTLKPPI